MTKEEFHNKKKLEYFEYMIFKFKEWYEENGRLDFCDKMSRFKVQKLLFFCASVKNPYGEDLLNVFDNFYAAPTGFVEADIHQAMVDDAFTSIRLKERTFSFKTSYFETKLGEYEKEKIDIAVGCLKAVSPKLVWYYAMDLGEMHRCWTCWKAYNMTYEALGRQSMKCPTDLIRKDNPKFRSINYEMML